MTQEAMINWLVEWVAAHQGLPPAQIDPAANLFDSGYVDSLGIYRLLFELSEAAGVEIDIESVLERAAPTLTGIAEAVSGE